MDRLLLAGLVSGVLILGTASSTLAAQDGDGANVTIWDGVYTNVQAERGKAAYGLTCSRCHNADLSGSDRGPALVGDEFQSHWVDGSLELLFNTIRDTMPQGSANTVGDGEKIDILAFVLQGNGLPAGDADLSPVGAALGSIAFTRRGIWNGVYTEAQAARGQSAFDSNCVRCHGADLAGDMAPALAGEDFIAKWETGSLGGLFTKIRDSMPQNAVSVLEPEAKLDIVAYILKANTFPAGEVELSVRGGGLDSVQILRKGAAPVVPNFALVQMVGCLDSGPNQKWVLRSSTAPVVTRDGAVAPAEVTRAGTRPLGQDTYTLVSAAPFDPASNQGHRVAAKGLLYREPGDNRLNLTSLASVAERCESP